MGGQRILKPFVLDAHSMQRMKITTREFADISERAIETLGRDVAYWVLRNMTLLTQLGYDPYKFSSDTERLLQERGANVARWYASGFGGVAEVKFELLEQIRRIEKMRVKDLESYFKYNFEETLLELRRRNDAFDPLEFKEKYLEILDAVGQSAATCYAICMREGMPSWRAHEVSELQSLPEELKEFHRHVSKKVFSSAMWFAPKIAGVHVVKVLNDIERVSAEHDEEVAIDAIKYTYGIKKREGTQDFLTLPPKHITANQDDEEQEL